MAARNLCCMALRSSKLLSRPSHLLSVQMRTQTQMLSSSLPLIRKMSMDAQSVASKLNSSGLLRTQGLIGGKWSDAYDGKTIKVYNPATGESIADVACMGGRETNDAISAAYTAYRSWSKTTAAERSKFLRKWYDLLMAHKEELAQLITLEQGKTLKESIGEINYGAGFIEFSAEEAKRVYGDIIPAPLSDRRLFVLKQNDNQPLVPVHNSHVFALSQICPNNLNGSILTPLDLCDTNQTSPDGLSLGYQGSHTGGLPMSNHSSVPPVHPSAGLSSSIPSSSGVNLGNNLSSSGPLGASARDSRYGVSRTPPLSVDEQQRIQQYNQMLSSRNMQQSTISVPGSLSGSDRGGGRILPGSNGMGMMSGINRSMTMTRPGFPGIPSSSMLSSGGMLSSSMVGMPSPVNIHPGVGAGQSNSMLRPRETVHMMRPGHNQEHQRQTMVPELPTMQVTQGNSQGIPAFSGMSSAFNNQTTPPSVQSYAGHAQQSHQLSQQQSHLSNPRPLQGSNHATNPQQAYAIRLAKERHLQQHQRYLQHQQQQLAASSALIQHGQTQSQLPISSPVQNNSQAQPQNSSQQVSLSPVTPTSPLTPISSQQQQQKHHLPHGFSRNPGASALTNQAAKQRQRQPQQRQYPQPGRQHPNQPQHAQAQQQAKLLKGLGRGNMVHQNNSVDSSHLNGLSVPPGSQTVEKGDQIMSMMQGQNLYPGSGNPNQPPKPVVPAHSSNHSQLQQKLHSGPTNTSLKQLQPVVSPSDNSIPGNVLSVTAGHMASSPQTAVASNHHQLPLQSQPQCKQSNQTPSVQRILQQNCQVHSELSNLSQSDSPKVDQHPANSGSQVGTNTAMSPGCMDAASVTVPPAASSQWKTSESPFDSSLANPVTQVSSLGSTTHVGNEQPTINQGMGPQQLPTSVASHPHNSGGQWQQQPMTLQQQTLPQPIPTQQYQSPEHQQQQEQEHHSPKDVASQHQPQQQVKHMQQGQSSLLIRPPNSKVE